MCNACLIESIKERMLSRRDLLKGAAGATLAAGGLAAAAAPAAHAAAHGSVSDLTHELHDAFPTFSGSPQFSTRRLTSFDSDGYNVLELTVNEHTGTHVDAPLHFSEDGLSVAEDPGRRSRLPALRDRHPRQGRRRRRRPGHPRRPLGLDRRQRRDPRPGLRRDALRLGRSRRHRPVPERRRRRHDALPRLPPRRDGDAARDERRRPRRRFPLARSRPPRPTSPPTTPGSPPVAGALECVAGLDAVPAAGATIVVGAPKHRGGGTGGPARVLALS